MQPDGPSSNLDLTPDDAAAVSVRPGAQVPDCLLCSVILAVTFQGSMTDTRIEKKGGVSVLQETANAKLNDADAHPSLMIITLHPWISGVHGSLSDAERAS